jgi:hypothetical protein
LGILVGLHQFNEPIKKVVAVLWAWAGFGMVLNRKDGAANELQTAIRAIEQ